MTAYITCVLELGLFFGCAVLLLRPPLKAHLINRAPLLLGAIGPLLILGLGNLPRALPSLFRRLLGHPIGQFNPIVNGTWFEERWLHVLLIVWLLMIAVAILWALLNLRARRSVVMNLVSLVACAVWIGLLILGAAGYFVWYL